MVTRITAERIRALYSDMPALQEITHAMWVNLTHVVTETLWDYDRAIERIQDRAHG